MSTVGEDSEFNNTALWANYTRNGKGSPQTGGTLRGKGGNLSNSKLRIRKYFWDKTKTIDELIAITSKSNPSLPYRLVIAEPSKNFSSALWEYFYDVSSVKIIVSDLSSVISPSESRNHVKLTTEWIPEALIFEGNVHGIRDSSSRWNELTQLFGNSICEKIRDYIKTNYLGQAPLYTSFIVKTPHPVLKYLIYTASSSRKLENRHSFSALWSSFACLQAYNKMNEPITSFVCRGFGNGLDVEESARQMFLAYYTFACPPVDFTRNYFDAIEKSLASTDTKIKPEERVSFFIERLVSGEIEKRGFIEESSTDILISLVQDKEKWTDQLNELEVSIADVQKAAAKVLVHYAFPDEYFPGLRDRVTSSAPVLDTLLELVRRGEVTAHYEIENNELEMGDNPIAVGASGKVYKGALNGQTVAIKVFSEEMLSFSITEFQREVAIMSLLKHENLIELVGAMTKSKERLVIVTTYVPGGSLYHLLQNTSIDIPYTLALKFAYETARGMNFLHSKGIIHRDLKSLNILINETNTVKIIDFGTSRVIDRDRMMTNAIGTVSYMAPEIFKSEHYTEKADVYSFGIVMWEMLTRKQPFYDVPGFSIPVAVTEGKRPVVPRDCHPLWAKLMVQCWDKKPSKRPSFKEIEESLKTMQNRIDISRGSSSSAESL